MKDIKGIIMFSMEIFLLGLALAFDAAVVTFAVGLMHKEHSRISIMKRGILICCTFGFFQALMMWLGSYAGYIFTFSSMGYLFQVIVGAIFFGLAIKFVQESTKKEVRELEWGVIPIMILAFATSIDAFAAGISLGTIPHAHWASFEVGLVTFGVCAFFYLLSQFFQEIPERWLLRLSAMIFIFLCFQTVWSIRHLFFLRGL